MNAADFDAVAYDGAVYCTGCLPDGIGVHDAEVSPVFADSEWDSYPVCDHCGAEHDYVSLTTYGRVQQRVRELETATGEDGDTVAFAYAAWCQDHHTGQWSDEYQAPTILGVRFGAAFRGRESLGDDERAVYDACCDEAGCDHDDE